MPMSKNAWRYTSIPQYVFMARCLVNRRDKFTFYLSYKNLEVTTKLLNKAKRHLASIGELRNYATGVRYPDLLQ